MTFVVDAQLPPNLAPWLTEHFGFHAVTIKNEGLRDARDIEIFETFRKTGFVILTKDEDFLDLVSRLGVPPQIMWVTVGNSTNRHLKSVFLSQFQEALRSIESGEPIVAIG